MPLQNFLVEVQYDHTQSDLDLIDVVAPSRDAAVAEVRNRWRFSRWTDLRDVTIQSVIAHERSGGSSFGNWREVER
jgi:hypothetical protein